MLHKDCIALATARSSRAVPSSQPARGPLNSARLASFLRPFRTTACGHAPCLGPAKPPWVARFRESGDDGSRRDAPARGAPPNRPDPSADLRRLSTRQRATHAETIPSQQNEEQPAFTNPWFFLSKTLQPGTHGDKPHPQEDKQHGNGQSRESNGAARGSRPGGGDVDADAESAAVGEPEGRAGADPSDRAEAAAAVSDGGSGSALPPTALSGEELLQSAPATPVILAQTLDDKVAEIIARYRLMDDRMAAVERQMMDLVRKLRAAPPGAVLAVPPLTAGAAPPPQAASEGPAAATTTAGPAEVSQAGLAPALGPQPQQPHPHGVAAAAAGGAGTGTATASKGQQAAADLLSGGGSSEEGKSRLFEINRIQSAITEVVNSGYLESVKGLRETLLVQEWGLQTKSWAQRRGVSAFEKWCAEHAVADVSYDTISVLYDDPDALHVLPTPRLRMMARAMIEQHTLQAYDEVFQRCTATAESMARVGLGDLLPHTAGVGQVLRGLLPGGLPFLSAGFWRRGLRQLWPFGRGGK